MPISPLVSALLALYAFLWGAVWGSFLNVVIWRLPRGMNLSRPASHCPSCGTPIRWYDNVPVLGWVALRGRCRACGTRISPRYPAVELLVGLLSWALWCHVTSADRLSDATLPVALMMFAFVFYFMLAMVAAAFIDLDLTIIPHAITLPAMGWGLLAALMGAKTGVWSAYFPSVDLVDAVLGLIAGGGVLFLVFYGYLALRGVPGGGGGDITLLAAIGANLGWQSLVFVLMAASVQGLVAAVAASAVGSRRRSAAETSGLLIAGAHTEAYWAAHPVIGARSAPGTEEPAGSTPEDATRSASALPDPGSAPLAPGVPAAEDAGAAAAEPLLRLAVPFGPFLALAAIEYVLFGAPVMRLFTSGMYP